MFMNTATIATALGAAFLATTDAAPISQTSTELSCPDGNFNLLLNAIGSGDTETYRPIFERAVNKWKCVITSSQTLTIDFKVSPIDGVGGILGQAGPTRVQRSNNLPTKGTMQFDSADIENMDENGTLEGVILHEMGHVLGIGTLWDYQRTLINSGCSNASPSSSSYFRYLGEKASFFFQSLGFSGSLLIENDGGSGTKCGHFDENQLGNELMTGYVDSVMPLSKITIGTLEDLGYSVDYTNAELFGPDFTGPLSVVQAASSESQTDTVRKTKRITFGDDILNFPIEQV